MAAERRSDGEIVTIIAGRSDSYHDVALHYSVLAMLAVPAALALIPGRWIDSAEAALLGWNGHFTRGELMVILFALMALVFLLVRVTLASMDLRMMLTPARTKSRRVHRRAMELFRTGCELKTRGRTGILLYLSLAEHRAEIVADRAIAERAEPEIWGEAMDALIGEVKEGRPGEGMVQAVDRIGTLLASLLPPSTHDDNELPDRLVEL